MTAPKTFNYREHSDLVLRSTIKIFKETFGLVVSGEKPVYTDTDFDAADVSSTVCIIQNKMEATMALFFSHETIYKMMMKIYRQDPPNLEKSIGDTAGEICNMIFCSMKQDLNSNGHNIIAALPTVVVGDHHKVSTYLQGSKFIMKIKCEVGEFQIGLTESKTK